MVPLTVVYQVISSIALVAVSGLFFEALSRLLQASVRRAGGRTTTERGIRDGFWIIWLAVSAWGLLSIWGVTSAFSVLSISGIAGLTLSLALQAVLTNMISGFLLLRDGAIRVGDRIEYGGVKGRVERIALRNTWIRTEGGSLSIVGNSALAGGPLTNHSAAERMAAETGLAERLGQPSSTDPKVARP